MQHKWLIKGSKLILVSVILLLVLVGCARQSYVEINEKKIIVEIADTSQERAQGLMFRESLCQNCGMLFIFEEEEMHSFWMKNTLIPLDMIFLDKNGIITDIIEAEPCVQDPCPYYTSSQPGRYVLEINKGVSAQHSFTTGQKVILNL